MALATFTAGNAMDRVAALLNDVNKDLYTYVAQLPYLKVAWDEIKERLEEIDFPINNEVSTSLHVVAGQTDIGGATGPALPNDLIELQAVYERTWGSSEDYGMMERREFVPLITTPTSGLMYWAWMNQTIQFPVAATSDRDVKLQYLGDTLGVITDENTIIRLLNAQNALAFRTAALSARFVGENPTRADELDNFATGSMSVLLNTSTKHRQAIVTRRRPFRAAWKRSSIT